MSDVNSHVSDGHGGIGGHGEGAADIALGMLMSSPADEYVNPMETGQLSPESPGAVASYSLGDEDTTVDATLDNDDV